MLIKTMLKVFFLDLKVKINICPTIRESNGLALSSRNVLLTLEERKIAGEIYKNLQLGKDMIKKGKNLNILKENLSKFFKINYININNFESLYDFENIDYEKDIMLTIAVTTLESNTRLLDNILINLEIL